MKVRLLRPARIHHPAGDTVEVSPAEAHYLISLHTAQPAEAGTEAKEAGTEAKKKTKATK